MDNKLIKDMNTSTSTLVSLALRYYSMAFIWTLVCPGVVFQASNIVEGLTWSFLSGIMTLIIFTVPFLIFARPAAFISKLKGLENVANILFFMTCLISIVCCLLVILTPLDIYISSWLFPNVFIVKDVWQAYMAHIVMLVAGSITSLFMGNKTSD